MRLRLLVLLIITQCYSVSTEADINSLEGTVHDSPNLGASRKANGASQTDQWRSKDGESPYARLIRDTSESSTEEPLTGLTKEELQTKLANAKTAKDNEESEKTRIEGELTTKKSESESSRLKYEDAKKIWEDAAKQLKDKRPDDSLEAELNAQKGVVGVATEAVTTALNSAQIPEEEENKKQFAIDKITTVYKLALPFNSSQRIGQLVKDIRTLDSNRIKAETDRNKKIRDINETLSTLLEKGCPEEGPSMGEDDCAVMRGVLITNRNASVTANATFKFATEVSKRAKNELHLHQYLDAVNVLEQAQALLNQAEKREQDASADLKNIRQEVADKLFRMNAANSSYVKKQGEVTKLDNELAEVQTRLDAATTAIKRYEAELKDKKDTPVEKAAGLPWEIIGGAGGGSLLAIVAVALLLYFCWWKKRKGRQESEGESVVEGGDDPCLVLVNGKLMPDEKLFKYKKVVQMDAYEGDLPHDKANEKVKELPKDYKHDKNRLFYCHYGLDKPIKSGRKPPVEIVDPKRNDPPRVGKRYIASDFFQPEYLSGVSDGMIVDWFKAEKQFGMMEDGGTDVADREFRCAFMPDEYIVTMNNLLHKKDPAKYPEMSKPRLKKAKVRSEFLDYLHMMAAAPCKDNDATSRINMDLTHIMWICCNARETLVEHHTSQLHEFSGSVVVVADTHGQFPDLLRMFASRATKEKPGWLTHNYIFLGDYVDRGLFSLESMMFLFLLKILYPKNITLLRGNHEDLQINHQYGFSEELTERYKQCVIVNYFNYVWRVINDVFFHLPVAALLNGNVFFAHGGIAKELVTEDKTLVDFFEQCPIPYVQHLQCTKKFDNVPRNVASQTAWIDPQKDVKGFGESHNRGNNPVFGPDAFADFKKKHGIVMMIRGHQMRVNGISHPFEERSLKLLFSVPNYEDKRKNRAATIDIDVKGRMGIIICGKSDDIKTEEQAMDTFRQYHPLEKNMNGKEIIDDPTLRVTRMKGSDKNKGSEKSSDEKKANENKAEDNLLPEKTAEDWVDKVEDKDKKTEQKLLPEKTAEDKEDQVDENKMDEKTAEAPGNGDGFPNIPPPS